MKPYISTFLVVCLFVGNSFGQVIPAEDWTQTDCNGVEHNLFSELDAGEVVLMEIVMLDGCVPCINAAHYIANKSVIVPVFQTDRDEKALQIIQDCFPDRTVVGIDSLDIIWGLGSFHCLSQQEPLI